MNWVVLNKISGIILAGGGFGATSWFFWPKELPETKSIHVYVMSKDVSNDTASKEINLNIDRNFKCKVNSNSELILCDILEPRSFDDLGVGQFKVNPTKIKRDELKKKNNIYVLRFDEQYKDQVTSTSNPPTIEIVSTQETDKKYASLTVSTALRSDGVSKNFAIQAVLSNTKDISKSQEHLATISNDQHKMAAANKIFYGCEDPEQKTRARCKNVSQSLDILLNKIDKTPSSTSLSGQTNTQTSVVMKTLANADEKSVAMLFDVLNIMEKSKNDSAALSSATFGISDGMVDLFSNLYTKFSLKNMQIKQSIASNSKSNT